MVREVTRDVYSSQCTRVDVLVCRTRYLSVREVTQTSLAVSVHVSMYLCISYQIVEVREVAQTSLAVSVNV